jgi:hypothetical protein
MHGAAVMHHVHHVHHGGVVHDHSHHMSIADNRAKVHKDASLPPTGSHKNTDTRCCGLVSVSAIPATEIVVITPAAPSSRCETATCRVAAENAPLRHYRPPIA